MNITLNVKELRKKIEGLFNKEARLITLEQLNAPPVVLTKSYFGYPTGEPEKRLAEVSSWLEELNRKYNLGLEISLDIERHKVEAYTPDGQLVAFFDYSEVGKRVNKNQNFKDLLKLIETKMAGKEKFLRKFMGKFKLKFFIDLEFWMRDLLIFERGSIVFEDERIVKDKSKTYLSIGYIVGSYLDNMYDWFDIRFKWGEKKEKRALFDWYVERIKEELKYVRESEMDEEKMKESELELMVKLRLLEQKVQLEMLSYLPKHTVDLEYFFTEKIKEGTLLEELMFLFVVENYKLTADGKVLEEEEGLVQQPYMIIQIFAKRKLIDVFKILSDFSFYDGLIIDIIKEYGLTDRYDIKKEQDIERAYGDPEVQKWFEQALEKRVLELIKQE